MSNHENDSVESLLREAFDRSAFDDAAIDMDALRGRAHHQLQVRDVIEFGISHLVRAVLALLGSVYNHVQRPDTKGS